MVKLAPTNDIPSSYSPTVECCLSQEQAYTVYAAEIPSSHQISLSIFSTFCTSPIYSKGNIPLSVLLLKGDI